MSLFGKLVIAATHNPVVRKAVTATPPGKTLARRFVAGETLGEAMSVARDLVGSGMAVSMDLLGEEVHDDATAAGAQAEYLECLDRIAAEALDANISIKLTQLGLAFDESLAARHLDELAKRAIALGTTVTIDMEDSRFTEATIRLYEQAQRVHGNLGVCLQAYLHRTPGDLERIAGLGGHIRLCKGAYVEPEELAVQGGTDVNAAFARLLNALMAVEGVRPAIATHDDSLIEQTRKLAAKREAPFEFQLLYGVRTPLQRELLEAGFHVRIYVPYGSQWYAYLTRRLAERPANALFFARAVFSRS